MADMKLTAAQRKRLAREARKLAMECVENGPKMVNAWCGCAIGIVLKRADLLPSSWNAQIEIGHRLEGLVDPPWCRTGVGMLSGATCERTYHNNPTAVVFPLLALADVLESTP